MTTNLQKLNEVFIAKGGVPVIPEIKTDSDYGKASDSVAFLREYLTKAEYHRKKETGPILEQKKNIDALYKKFTAPLENTINQIKSQMIGYANQKREEQKLLEAEATPLDGEDFAIVEQVTVDKSQSDFSSSSVRELVRYRFIDKELNEIIEIPILKMKEYLKSHPLPSFIESYTEETITVRSKI